MDNLVGPLFTNLATINICMTNIVTKTKILAFVSLLFSTNYIRYRPIFGDILTDNQLLIFITRNQSLSASTHSAKHFLGVKTTDKCSEHADK